MTETKDLDNLQKSISELSALSESIKTYNAEIRWIIDNSDIEKCIENVGKSIKSDTFSTDTPSYCTFNFLLYPGGKDADSKNFVSVCIIFKKKALPESAWIQGKIYIDGLDCMKTFNFSEKDAAGRIELDNLGNNLHLKKLVRYNKNGCVLHCSLKIKAKEVKCVFDKESIDFKGCRYYDSSKESIKRDAFSDATIYVDGHEIKSYKAVLAQIPYFQKLFEENKCKERFELTGIKYENLVHVVDYLYTRNIPRLHFMLACELYVMASDLEISDLKNICSSYLGANLTENNVFIVVKLSHENSDFALKKECIEYIKSCNVETLAEKSGIF